MSEETPINSLGAGNIQGVQPEGPPVVQGTFAGCKVFDVDTDTFHKCIRGAKTPQARWKRFVDLETPTGNAIRDYSYKTPGRHIIVHNPQTGEMSYIKRGQSRSKP
jgi:hypothetical protein